MAAIWRIWGFDAKRPKKKNPRHAGFAPGSVNLPGEHYIPAAHEKLAWDQLPDAEPFTHLKPMQ